MLPKAIFNWSTGKDSALALYKVLQSGEYDVAWLLTTVNDRYDRVSMHGVRTELLESQAASLGIPLVQVRLSESPTMEAYERAMGETLDQLIAAGATCSIFGDIFLEDLRTYREHRLAELGLKAVFPLWQISTSELAREVIELGFTAITTCVNDRWLDRRFVGRTLDSAFLKELPAGVDPCGENGEFHTFACNGPIFRQPIPVTVGDVVYRRYEQPAVERYKGENSRPSGSYTCQVDPDNSPTSVQIEAGFWYCDLVPVHGPHIGFPAPKERY
jgi:uncharacterized protein (TIGR00290 family)